MTTYILAARGVVQMPEGKLITRDMIEWEAYRQWLKNGGVPGPQPIVVPDPPKLEEAKATALASMRAECRARIYAKWPAESQLSATLGVYPPDVVDQIQSDVAAMVEECNKAEDAIDRAVSLAEVSAVAPVWPI